MTIELGVHRYGKSSVRLATVERTGDRHEFRDVTVDVALEGDFEASYVRGDNADVLPTDTMRATVYALAGQEPVGDLETFGVRLGQRFLAVTPAASRAQVRLAEQPWDRIAVTSEPDPHPHAFTAAPGGLRTATVTATRDADPQVAGGISGWRLLKTAGSAFEGFLRDRFTTLEDTRDRILATTVTADWVYDASARPDYGKVSDDVRRVLSDVFAVTASESVQHLLHAMGQAVLEARPELTRISFTLPNQHHVLADLSPYGLDNDGRVFRATEQPFGLIEGTVVRR